MPADAYPWPLVKRLLESWPDLAEGSWPASPGNPEGYRGQVTEAAPWEPAIVACADLWLAVERLRQIDRELADAVVARYWRGRRVPYRWNELIDAVHTALRLRTVTPA